MKHGKITTHNYTDQRFQPGQQYFQLPGGSTSERPADPETGMLRFNVDEGSVEGYSRGQWSSFLATADFRIPGVQFPEDENVTIASLATLLRQFQRTVVGGVDVLAPSVSSPDDTSLVGMPIPEGGGGASGTPLEWVSQVTRGSVIGYMDEAGKGETFIQCRTEGSASLSVTYQSFEAIIDPYSLSGFAEDDRHDYLFDYFMNLYGYQYALGDYENRGATCSITPAWDLLDPWNDANYGKFRVHVSLCLTDGNSAAVTDRGFGFSKWFIKMVRFRNFRLQNVPELAPGGGSLPMPNIVDVEITPNDFKQFTLVNYLLRKYPTWSGGPAEVFIHIKPNSVLYASDPGAVALDLTGMPNGSKVYIRNEGYILGHGGLGGSGGGLDYDGSTISEKFPSMGGTGGTAIEMDGNATVYLDNRNGEIHTGGGGGGGGAYVPLFQDIPSHISVLGGGCGGPGGAEQGQPANGENGSGELEQNPNDPTQQDLVETDDLRGSPGNVSVYRSGGGIDLTGASGSSGGEFLITSLSGAVGGTGGVAGQPGGEGGSVTGTPNIMIIGWQTAGDVDGEDRLVFGDEDVHLKNGSHGGQTWTDVQNVTHDINWFNSWLLPQLDGNGDVDYTIEPFSNKEVVIDVGGSMVSVPVEVGFVVVSTSRGSAASDWNWESASHFVNNGVVYPPQSAGGASDQTFKGARGGSAGFSIEGTASLIYSLVDPSSHLFTPGDESTYGGTIVGLQRS